MAKSSTFFGELGGAITGTLGILATYDQQRAQRKFDLRQLELNSTLQQAEQKSKTATSQAIVIGLVVIGALVLFSPKKLFKR